MSDRLAEIEARANAATPGPWVWEGPTIDPDEEWDAATETQLDRSRLVGGLGKKHEGNYVTDQWLPNVAAATEEPVLYVFDADTLKIARVADGDFIANARDDIPWLIAEVKRLRNLVASFDTQLIEGESRA